MTGAPIWFTAAADPTVSPFRDPLAGHREESVRWDVLSLDDVPMGTLDGVEASTLEQSIYNTIRGGGSLQWARKNADAAVPDWARIRLQLWYTAITLDGTATWPLGVFIPAAPTAGWDDDGMAAQIELYDKLLVLDQDSVEKTYTLAQGKQVTAAVKQLITSAGENRLAVTDSPEVAAAPMVWEAGTSKLRIINDLLDSINYFSLWCDGYGMYRVEPYSEPASRRIARDLVDDAEGLYEPEFDHARDTFAVPNKVILVARSDSDVPPLVATATNVNPASPGSFPQRGRWVTVVESGVEATSQAVLNTMAARRLRELSQVSSGYTVKTAMVPLDLNDAVHFRNLPAGADVTAVVQSMTVNISTDLNSPTATMALRLLEVMT